ncbi:MAG: hypothetical protein ACF8OB_12930 [Phycisphaeraceae bacterium JB051]
MIPRPTFEIVGLVTGQAEFAANERKPRSNMLNSTFKQQEGNRKFYVLQTMGSEFPITLTDDLKDAMADGQIYKLTGEMESVRGGLVLRVRYIDEADEVAYMTHVPKWEGVGVVSHLEFDTERDNYTFHLSIPGVALRFYGVPKGKLLEDAKGQLAKVNGVLATRNNQRTGSTSIDTQFGNIEYVDAKDVLKSTSVKTDTKKVNGTKQPDKQPA